MIRRYVMKGFALKLESESYNEDDGQIIEVTKDGKYGTGTFIRTVEFAD